MASHPNIPPRSRGRSLYERQVELNAPNSNKSIDLDTSYNSKHLPPLKSSYSIATPNISTPPVTQNHRVYSPILPHRHSPSSVESYAHTRNNNVQLISVQPRTETNYFREISTSPPLPPKLSSLSTSPSKYLETDFPVYENIPKEQNNYTYTNEKSSKYSPYDDDDDVIHQESFNEQNSTSDSFDDETEYNLNTTTSVPNDQNDSKFLLLRKKFIYINKSIYENFYLFFL